MPTIFEKLNLKDHAEIVVLGAPASFEPALAALAGVKIVRDPKKAKAIHFALAFATKKAEIDRLAPVLTEKADGDALIWFAYPKGTSKNYQCDFNRDTGWDVLRGSGFEPVRQVAIDDDWSALRFRRSEFVKARSSTGPAAATAPKSKPAAKASSSPKSSPRRGRT